MISLTEDRDLIEESILGDYDLFKREATTSYCNQNDDIFEIIYSWNCEQIKTYTFEAMSNNGVELICGNRIFVIAANPKLTKKDFPWRCTHYIKDRGPLYDELFERLENAIIDVFLSYPDTIMSKDTLDNWVSNFNKFKEK